MRRNLKKVLFYILLIVVGSVVIESDILTGHHESLRLIGAKHWVEEPRERENEDV